MKNTSFKMKGMSFGNSPLKDHVEGHPKKDNFMRTSYTPPPKSNRRKKRKKAFKFTKAGKLLRSIFGGGGSRGGSNIRLGCSASGSCN